MTSKPSRKKTSKPSVSTVAVSVSAPVINPNPAVRSCGCPHRFLPTPPQFSQSAPVLSRRRSRSSTGSSGKSGLGNGSGRNTPSPTLIPTPIPAARSGNRFRSGRSRMHCRAKSETHLADLSPPSPQPPPRPLIQPPPIRPMNEEQDDARPEPQPVYFSTTLFIRVGTDRRHCLEQVKYEMRYGYDQCAGGMAGCSGPLPRASSSSPLPTQRQQVEFQKRPEQFHTEVELQLETKPD